MKAARLHAYGQRLVIEDVPTPRPDRGQVTGQILCPGRSDRRSGRTKAHALESSLLTERRAGTRLGGT